MAFEDALQVGIVHNALGAWAQPLGLLGLRCSLVVLNKFIYV